MKILKNNMVLFLLVVALTLVVSGPMVALAATTPNLGAATTFGVLSSTYTNTLAGTINGDLGYTTPPDTATTVNGTTHITDATYTQAGIDQDWALHNLTGQAATFTFADGAIDLATDVTHGPIGVYAPGVYVINGAANVGGGGTITLNSKGTYIFIIRGALNTSANSIVQITGDASVCDVFWVPTATTLGADSSFLGTVIDNAGITVGNNVTWSGRALDFATTVTTNNDTITVPAVCVAADQAAAAKAVADAAAEEAARKAASDAAAAQAAADADAAAAAKLPDTGIAPSQNSVPWNVVILSGIFVLASTSLVVVLRKRKGTI